MSVVLSECVTEVVRQMVQLTGAVAPDNTRQVSAKFATVLPQVTPAAILMELRGYVSSRFTFAECEWSEVGQSGEGKNALIKMAAKPPRTVTHYFTIDGNQVRRVIRAKA